MNPVGHLRVHSIQIAAARFDWRREGIDRRLFRYLILRRRRHIDQLLIQITICDHQAVEQAAFERTRAYPFRRRFRKRSWRRRRWEIDGSRMKLGDLAHKWALDNGPII
ncbi:hypothetical protein xavtCFBP7764_22930 [Xanthomonas citri]|nr:hypothetical protein xavtCFBP7764_22930 [Xanthomonas citri]